MRIIVLIFTFLIGLNSFSQNKQVLYDFAGLPQTLLLNPGLEIDYKFHIGMPLLSGFSSEIKSTGFSLSEIFSINNNTINDKISAVLNKIDANDYLKVNTQIEVFSAGFRFDKKTYVSFGFYQELDAIGYAPVDALTLINEGNTGYLNKSFSISEMIFKLDVLGVIHVGISRKVSDKLTLGGRFKVYSSALNLETTNNQGTFTTRLGNNNIYTHHLDNVNLNVRTSGLISNNEYISDASTYIENSLLGGNLGAGIDLGFTYHVTPQLQFSGSLIDFGFVQHTKNIKNNLIEGSFTFEGIEFEFDSNRNYWGELDAALKEQLPIVNNEDSYTSWRPSKVNAAIKYSFGEKRSKYCYDNILKDFYTNAFGAQLYSVFRPLRQQFALTSFYEKSFSNKLQAKITYTIDDYSYYNIGVGVSAKIWKINFYGILDNLTKLSDISSANNVSLQFGFNLLFN
ncbi:MAG: hypothetical protein ACI93N_001650 [Flavobacteriaceae bacterium]|jgi:hypothetical protein